MRCGRLASVFILILICGTAVLSSCKDEQADDGTTVSNTSEATAAEEKTVYQLAREELEQYGGASGMIEYIESFIAEHGTVEDVRDLYVLEPLIRLYFGYTGEELSEHFGVSQSEIEDAAAKVAGSISEWTINTASMAWLVTLCDGDERGISLYYKLYGMMSERKGELFSRTIINHSVPRDELKGLLAAAQANITISSKPSVWVADALPEYSPGERELDTINICGQVRVSLDNNIFDGVPVEFDNGVMQWKGIMINRMLYASKTEYNYSVTSEWLDKCLGGKHGEVKEYTAQTMYNYSSDEYNSEGGTEGVALYYSGTDDGLYEDWVILHPKGMYFAIRFFNVASLSVPSPSEIIEGLQVYWIIFLDTDKLKVAPYEGVVTDAYRLDKVVEYPNMPGLSYRNMLYIPQINKSGAHGVNARMRRDILADAARKLPYVMDGTGMFVNITYMYTVKDDIICVAVSFINGKLASDTYTTYKCYYFDTVQNREITLDEYITRLGINIDYILKQLNNEFNFRIYVEYYYAGNNAWSVAEEDISYICARDDGTYDIYTNADNPDSAAVFFFKSPFREYGRWHVHKPPRGGFKEYHSISFIDTTLTENNWTTFNHPSVREYKLNWLDDNTAAVKYWTDEQYSSFFIADLSFGKAECDFNITLKELMSLCGVSRRADPDGEGTLDISFARMTGNGADRTVYASFAAAYTDADGALSISGELSMKPDGSGLKCVYANIE